MQRAKYGEILWNYRIHDISLHDCQMDLIGTQGTYSGRIKNWPVFKYSPFPP